MGLQSERFFLKLQVCETPNLRYGVDDDVVALLADRDPQRARDFLLAWEEARVASWANAAREASTRAASPKHLIHLRGQLRAQLGEAALRDAAQTSGVGAIPMETRPAGGVFMVARVGRFALVSLVARQRRALPRPSTTRDLLSQPNQALERQERLALGLVPELRGATELAYFGCLIAVRAWPDPTVPSELVLAIPTVGLDDWIVWMPLAKVQAALLNRVHVGKPDKPVAPRIPDRAFPRFRVPKRDEGTSSGGSEPPTK